MSVVKMELPSPFPRVEQKASLNPERIRCARETAGLSKVQLAESLGVTSRTVANYEEVGTRDIEGEAHSFAAHLLMPKRRVLGMVLTRASVSQILAAKRYFKVSAMAMARRAYELGRLSEWEYRQICSELTVQGYKSGEPRGLRPEQSKVFRFVADTNRQKGISVSTVSEETGLVPKELHGLSFGNIWAVTGGSSLSQRAILGRNESV